jgi:membrane-associated phospholipid phosphatase
MYTEGHLNCGVEFILWFQQFSPTLDLPFTALTLMGGEVFLVLFVLLLYWCIDRRMGIRLGVLFLLSGYLNTLAKAIANQPRPFEYDTRVKKLFVASGGGFPSGHTQNTVVIWGYVASRSQSVELWLTAGLLMVLVPLSRVYLGLHFPTDLLGGYLFGALTLLLYCWLEPIAEAWLRRRRLALQLGLAFTLPALLMLAFPGNDKNGIIAASTLMGMGIGFALERHWVNFSTEGIMWKRALRFLLGSSILLALVLGLRATFDGLEPEPLFRFVRYGLVGLWGAFGAPLAFVWLGLCKKE